MRHRSLGLLLLCVSLAPLDAAAEPPAPAIRATAPVVFPAYEAYARIQRYAPTKEAYRTALDDTRFVMERVTYQSDGLLVFAYLYRPRTPAPGARLPVVIYNRGSWVRDDFAPEVLMLGRRLADKGYVVLAPMYRGSGGAPGQDEVGGGDLNDIFNLLPVVKELPYADPQRLFLYGESRGGIMCLMAARDGFPARAMAVFGAITDFGKYIAEGQPGRAMAAQVWPTFPANEAEVVATRSALRWPEKIGVPVLIMNGGRDPQVSPQHALALAGALEALQKPYELKIFHGERHGIDTRAEERDADTLRWFERFDVPRP